MKKNKGDTKTEKAIAAEKEQFGKQQLHFISKTLTSSEAPPKERYVRDIILGTYKESGCATFWSYCLNLPLSSNSLVSWKFCYLLHKVLRDGHRNSVRDSHRFCINVKDMGILWGNLHDRYGHIVALSAKFLNLKMEFHAKHKVIPANMEASDDTLYKEAGNDPTKVLDMTQELLEYLDAALKFEDTVLRQLDANGAKSTTAAGQCRLTPLIPLILDCSFIYHFSVLLLFKLHSRIPPDALLGHRERFRDLFNSLTQFFDRAREIEFLKSRIQIPDLPDEPPNFLRAAALGEYKKPVIVVPKEDRPVEEEVEQPELKEAPQYYMMGSSEVAVEPRESENDSLKKELEALKPELHHIKTEAQRCVTELRSQVNRLEAELEEQRSHKQAAMLEKEHLKVEVEALRCANVANAGAQIGFHEADSRAQAAQLRFCQLKERHAELITSHADLMKKNAETVKLLSGSQYSQDDLLRAKQQLESELESLRQDKINMMNAQQQDSQRLNKELLEQRAQLAYLRSTLENKEKEGSQASSSLLALQAEREVLQRSVREQEAELSVLKQNQGSTDQERDRLNAEILSLRAQLQQQMNINAEQKLEIDRLRRELESTRAELNRANSSLHSKEMSGSQLSSSVAGLQAEREALVRSQQQQEAELHALRQQLQALQGHAEQDRHRHAMELGSLHAQLQQQACREGDLSHKLSEEQFCLLQCAVVEAEGIILDAVAKLDDPVHIACVSSPDYLINRAEITLSSIDKMQQSHSVYLGNMNDASGLLRSVTQFSHLAADTIVNGSATSHSAPTDHADRLTDTCRDCATHCLQYLKDLKLQASLPRADPNGVRFTVQRLLALGQELRPIGRDVLKEELGSMVDREMIATSTAIEEAVLRMEEILSQAKKETSGVKLEVNQSIIGSCSDLMKAVHMLVTASTDLQKDIVEGGRGAASITDFYAKNSRWTEGLISASKAVGWGATQLLGSADRVVVGENGRYEELIACSHEIAASTAQLVAASKVKADRGNKKLTTLQHASRHVNDMAAVVVTSTKHGQQQISDQGVMDFSGLSLIKLKTEEMEAQVKVLQLESELEQERVRLGELRKRHYELQDGDNDTGASASTTTANAKDDGLDSFPPPPPPTLLEPSPQEQPFSSINTQSTNPFAPGNNTQSFTPASTANTQAYTPASTHSYTPVITQNQAYTPANTHSYTPASNTHSYTPPSTQPHTPANTQHQAYLPTQTYSTSNTYTPIPIQTSSPYTPALSQPYTPALSQTYTPVQPYTPSQSYTPQVYNPAPVRAFTPTAQSYTHTNAQANANTTPNHVNLNPPSSSGSQPSPKPPRANTGTATRQGSKTAKIGNLLKNAFKRGESGTGES